MGKNGFRTRTWPNGSNRSRTTLFPETRARLSRCRWERCPSRMGKQKSYLTPRRPRARTTSFRPSLRFRTMVRRQSSVAHRPLSAVADLACGPSPCVSADLSEFGFHLRQCASRRAFRALRSERKSCWEVVFLIMSRIGLSVESACIRIRSAETRSKGHIDSRLIRADPLCANPPHSGGGNQVHASE